MSVEIVEYGAPDRNRTCNPWIRSPILYPIELRAHTIVNHVLLENPSDKVATLYPLFKDPSTLKTLGDTQDYKSRLYLPNTPSSVISRHSYPLLRKGPLLWGMVKSRLLGFTFFRKVHLHPFQRENFNDSERTIVSRYHHVSCERTLLYKGRKRIEPLRISISPAGI